MNEHAIMKKVQRMQKWVNPLMLPDLCLIYPADAGTTVDKYGVTTLGVPVARQYKGVDNTPCWYDSSRSFRPENLPAQAITADEYKLVLPADVVIYDTDIIVNPVTGERFTIRKLNNLSVWDVTRTALIESVSAQ